MDPKTLILRSGTVFDPATGCEGLRRDIAVCGDRIVAPELVSNVDEIVDASGMVVTAAAVDCAAHAAFPGVWALRAAGLFPDGKTLARRYVERGFGHVHESWATLFDWATVQAEWARMPGPDVSVGLALPLDDLTAWMEAQEVGAAQRALQRLSGTLGAHGFFLPEPRVRFRNEVYRHREKSAKDVVPFLSAACGEISGPVVLPARSLRSEDLDVLSPDMHVQRAACLDKNGETCSFPALVESIRRGLSADLGLAWPEKALELSWVPPDCGGGGRLWDVGGFLLLKAEPLPEVDFRDNAEMLRFLEKGIPEGWAISCRHANLALVEDWEGLIRAVLDVWTVRDWFLATRAHAAKALGFSDRGHLAPGARANVAMYREPKGETPAEWAKALSRCERLYVGGREVYDARRGVCAPPRGTGGFSPRAAGNIDAALFLPLLDGMSLRPETLRRLAPRAGEP